MKIYVASSWRNDIQPEVVEALMNAGHEVYDFRNPNAENKGFSWADIDENWENWDTDQYVEALNHPKAEEGFKLDFNAMAWAECCVIILPCGRSAHTEGGWMKGAGKKVFVFQPTKQEPELMYKIFDGIYSNIFDLLYQIDQVTKPSEVTDNFPIK